MALQRIDDPNDLAAFTEWKENPDAGMLPPRWRYVAPTNVYDYGDLVVTLSIDSDVTLMVCRQKFFNGDFAEGASCVLGLNEGANLPIHITFDPPVARVGAFVSADTTPNQDYLRQLGVKAAGANDWDVVTVTAPVTRKRGSAPFLGARYTGAARIGEVWFDVVNVPGNNFDIAQVAIGNLYFTQ